MDFSSAFNTRLPQILLTKLTVMKVNPYVIRWYYAFLIRREQLVKVNATLSDIYVISTGAPQGCVSSPLLFTLYTNDCRVQYANNHIIKFSDDTAILSLLNKHSDIDTYKSEIDMVVKWCKKSNLLINVKKTKEEILDPRLIGDHSPVTINGEIVEQVTTYKYLGVHFDSQLLWGPHVQYVCSRISQRLHFLRRLRVHGVNKNVMILFYRAAIESIVRYAITTWFGNLSVKLKSQLHSLINRAGKIMGAPPPSSLQEIYNDTARRQGLKITNDPDHVLHREFELLPSGRRYRFPNCRLNRFKFSFVPSAIKILNSQT